MINKSVFIGRLNTTNQIIIEWLQDEFEITIKQFELDDYVRLEQKSVVKAGLILFDLVSTPGNSIYNIKEVRKVNQTAYMIALYSETDQIYRNPLIETGADKVLSIAPSKAELLKIISSVIVK